MLPYLIAGAIGYGIAKLFEEDKLSKYADGGLIAPNGKPSNLTPEQYKLVRTPAFKQWFGDWENDPENASKVVDENGEPLVCYHATNNKFWEFSKEKQVVGYYGKGYYFSSSLEKAKDYGKRVIPAFLNIKSVFELSDETPQELLNELAEADIDVEDLGDDNDIEQRSKRTFGYASQNSDIFISNLMKNGFYGIKMAYDLESKIYFFIAFEPNQIKLADGTNTIFDSNNPDIRFDEGGNVNSGAFKKWFGNSKVVDKKGNPLIVYHGSPDLRGLKEKYIFESRFLDNQSFFFTDNYSMAKSYADPKRAFDYQNAEEGVIGLYLSLKNPLIVNAFNQIWRKFETTIDANEIIGTRNLINFAKNKGYDGVIVENVRDYYNNNDKKTKGGNVYVAFYPNQIKLANGSNTTFDSNNPDIRFDGGGKIMREESEKKIGNFFDWFEENGWQELNEKEIENIGLNYYATGVVYKSPDKNISFGFSQSARLVLNDGMVRKIILRYDKLPVIILDSLIVKEKGKGHGTKAIKLLTELADKYGVEIQVQPSPLIDVQQYLDKDQLIKFYKNAGFQSIDGQTNYEILKYNSKELTKDTENKYADGGLIAPNGKPSNLTPEQYELVRTPAFKQWFGDWQNDPENSSKVVDSNGEPLICYHGSYDYGFNIFSKKFRGNTTGAKSSKKGFFFYDKKSDAKEYSKKSASGGIYEVFLKIKYPNIKNYNSQNVNTDKELVKLINSFEFDGAIALNIKDGFDIGNQYIVFEPEQIKLADGTNTKFDSNNPDIRYAGGGEARPFTDDGNKLVVFNEYRNYIPYKIAVDNVNDANYITLWKTDTDTGKDKKVGYLRLNETSDGFLSVSEISIDDKGSKGVGFGLEMYKTALKYSSDKIKGIVSYLPNRTNKKQIPKIYKKLNSIKDGDYEYILKERNPNIRFDGGGETSKTNVNKIDYKEKPYQVYDSEKQKVVGYFEHKKEAEEFAKKSEYSIIYDIREEEKVGKEFWYEYHCFESDDSCDAEIWYRSHQKVKVVDVAHWSFEKLEERIADAQFRVYLVEWKDGFQYDVFEDELMESKDEFYRPDPPKRKDYVNTENKNVNESKSDLYNRLIEGYELSLEIETDKKKNKMYRDLIDGYKIALELE